MKENYRIMFVSAVCVLLLSVNLFAGDGQIDILPNGSETFDISKRGSYVLTDNVMMSADVNCIDIRTHDVTLDMNGHTIVGMGDNSYGIYGSNASNVFIKNGRVQSFGRHGIYLSNRCRIENVTVSYCKRNGVNVGSETILSGVTASHNSGYGIYAGGSSIVEKCAALSNGGHGNISGINVASNSTVRDCVSSNNSSQTTDQNVSIYGIRAGYGCLIVNNICSSNVNNTSYSGGRCCGIWAGQGSIIRNNACRANTASNAGTEFIGIFADDRSTVTGNVVQSNSTTGEGGNIIGIKCDDGCLIKDNICSENSATGIVTTATGILAASKCRILNNTCDNNDGKNYSRGIYIDGGAARVEGNLCTGHDSVKNGIGIMSRNPTNNNAVIRNTTTGNEIGIDMGDGGHYCAENMTTDGIVNTASVTMGTGDRSNVKF